MNIIATTIDELYSSYSDFASAHVECSVSSFLLVQSVPGCAIHGSFQIWEISRIQVDSLPNLMMVGRLLSAYHLQELPSPLSTPIT